MSDPQRVFPTVALGLEQFHWRRIIALIVLLLIGNWQSQADDGPRMAVRNGMAHLFEDHNQLSHMCAFLSEIHQDAATTDWASDAISTLERGEVPVIPPSLHPRIVRSLNKGEGDLQQAAKIIDRIEATAEYSVLLQWSVINTPGEPEVARGGEWHSLFKHLCIGAIYYIDTGRWEDANKLLKLAQRINRLYGFSVSTSNNYVDFCKRQISLFSIISAKSLSLSPSNFGDLADFPTFATDVAFLERLERNSLEDDRVFFTNEGLNTSAARSARSLDYVPEIFNDLGESDFEIVTKHRARVLRIIDEEPLPVDFLWMSSGS